MLNKIKQYIDDAFSNVRTTKKIAELKDELYVNLAEKYNDQLSQGKTEQEAYNAAIAGIGDISELVDSVREPFLVAPDMERAKVKSGLLVSIAIMLYILSPLALILSGPFNNGVGGLAIMFVMVAAATGLLIYNGLTKPKYVRTDDSIVEEFKEFRSVSDNTRQAYKALSGAFWGLTVAVYLFVNFIFGWWAFSWILFILAAAAQNIVKAILLMKNKNVGKPQYTTNGKKKKDVFGLFTAGYWTLVVALYFIVNFAFGWWAFSWILFILAAAIQSFVRGMIQLKGVKENEE